ncbi:MAG: hypothetical protein NWT02_04690 [Opitutales bacterium]|jgi:hypothetical protein|nr:hypothetical protein [Opitutales bacterium]MDP4644142.1 hypothetical protein [Opitutales bacterium]MDP4778560.1 hypothetical protein [Opitutales bacterium]MDP4883784.1 hypothetical protein [Opitutales bacterium]MDP5080841.1 hypothetical protein [Opitutales bacterium]
MKTVLTFFVFALSLFFIGCASTSKRIDQNEALFKTYTPGEQRMIRTGQIAVGFDQDMVRMALGDPSREATVDTAAGKQVACEYREIKPSLGVSLGGGIGTRGSGVGIGTGVGVSPDRTRLLKRVIFDRQTGKVSKIESYD